VGWPTFKIDKHHARRRIAQYDWYPDLRAVGPRGRRHSRWHFAWSLGWAHQQNETESGDPVSPCPFKKRKYIASYENGRASWLNACWRVAP